MVRSCSLMQATLRVLTLKEPVGVIGAITPWNFPCAMITRKLAPALAAGCTAVLKPSEFTPLTALALVELAHRAGIPAGVINCLTGDPSDIGAALMSSDDVRKITFTGSTRVGKILMEQSANTVKRVSLELGGNAPYIVFDDASIEDAVNGLIFGKFRNMGQTCVTVNRILVQASVYEQFSTRLAEKVSELKVGNGVDAGVEQGPLINEAAVQKVEMHVADCVAKGGRVLVGGQRLSKGSLFFRPTVIIGGNAAMLCAQEETFGPVAVLYPFETEEEAITIANDTKVGLACYYYTSCHKRMWRLAEKLKYGMVGSNVARVSDCLAPFGGVKESGFGREGGQKYGIEDYLETKILHMSV